MIDDNIRTVYVCNICGRQYNKIENCQTCVKSHRDETIVKVIDLCMPLGCGTRIDYGFQEQTFIGCKNREINDKVSRHCLCEGWPHFRTECLDTPEEVLKAKSRLLKAAAEWGLQYSEKVKEMLQELEQGGDGK